MRRGELKDDGTFIDYPLDDYWNEPGRIPLLIRREGYIAGFALLNTVTHSGHPADRNMAEFFIVRKHRRNGVGLAVAREIFSRYPGPVGGRRCAPQHCGAGVLASAPSAAFPQCVMRRNSIRPQRNGTARSCGSGSLA